MYPRGACPLCGLKFPTFVWSVHFVDLIPQGVRPFCAHKFGPSWGPSTLWTYVGSLTLVRSIHFVDMNLNPSRGPSTLWTYVGFLPLLGPSILWTNYVLDPCQVRPFCRLHKRFTLIRSVHFVDFRKRFTLWGMSSSRTSLVVSPRRIRPLTVVIKHSLV